MLFILDEEEKVKLLHGDCLELMRDIPDKSIDMILCDMPYGTTDNSWDKALDLDKLWGEYKRIIKSGGAIVLFSQLPFAVDLINANRKWFRYEWIWEKDNATGFLNANKMPLRKHENILVFYDKLPTYNPQFTSGKPYFRRRVTQTTTTNYGKCKPLDKTYDGKRYPVDVIEFDVPKVLFGRRSQKYAAPTQKPVALLEYLINTYTNKGETVLDSCMGSGSTGVACMNTGRDFVGMELNEDFYNMAVDRINNLGGK